MAPKLVQKWLETTRKRDRLGALPGLRGWGVGSQEGACLGKKGASCFLLSSPRWGKGRETVRLNTCQQTPEDGVGPFIIRYLSVIDFFIITLGINIAYLFSITDFSLFWVFLRAIQIFSLPLSFWKIGFWIKKKAYMTSWQERRGTGPLPLCHLWFPL